MSILKNLESADHFLQVNSKGMEGEFHLNLGNQIASQNNVFTNHNQHQD